MKGIFSMVTFVCISLVAANLTPPPTDVKDFTNVKITANKVQGKSWNLYSYVIGIINLVKYVYNHTI